MTRRLFFFLTIFLIFTLGVLLFVQSRAPAPAPVSPAPTPYALDTVNRWLDIEPGASTLEDVTARLGAPVGSANTSAGTVYFFPSTNQYWKNEVTVQGDAVSFIVERVFAPAQTSLKALTAKLSGQPAQLYGPDFASGIFLFAYPALGIAYVTNPYQDTVYQVWRFPQTTLVGFLALPQAARYGATPKGEPEAF